MNAKSVKPVTPSDIEIARSNYNDASDPKKKEYMRLKLEVEELKAFKRIYFDHLPDFTCLLLEFSERLDLIEGFFRALTQLASSPLNTPAASVPEKPSVQ